MTVATGFLGCAASAFAGLSALIVKDCPGILIAIAPHVNCEIRKFHNAPRPVLGLRSFLKQTPRQSNVQTSHRAGGQNVSWGGPIMCVLASHTMQERVF